MKKMNSAKSMRGMGASGWIMAIIVVVVFVTAAIKIIPSALDFNTIKTLVNNVIADNKIGLKSNDEIYRDIGRRFSINRIEVINIDDITIEKENGELVITVDYEVREDFFANIDFVMTYKQEFRKNVR